MRILTVIAHHGTKNREYLLRMLLAIEAMNHDVDVVVVCEEPKELPPSVEQVVGLPSEDPWSLPFAHRPVFADRLEDYDLFVYSEDDTLIEQRHIDAFVELQGMLPDNMITGFMRYERDRAGARSFCTIHSHYRWLPASARRINGLTFARFTNDHAACYAVTQGQLRRAISSGGFLVEPHSGRYDMLVTAATDVYTQCGMEKYLCVDRLDDQLVHHMPDVYLGKLGVPEGSVKSQLSALRLLASEEGRPDLITPETTIPGAFWDRHCFPQVPEDLVASFEGRPLQRILNVAGTAGDLEVALRDRGHAVASIPMDPVFGQILADRGIQVVQPPIGAWWSEGGFDFIFALDVLPYVPDPVKFLIDLHAYGHGSTRLVATVPEHPRYAARNVIPGLPSVELPANHRQCGIHRTSARTLRRWLRASGWEPQRLQHRTATRREPVGTGGLRAVLLGNAAIAVAGGGH